MDAQQVMGPSAKGEVAKMAPKSKFTGENTSTFKREFPFAAHFYGVADAFDWDEDRKLSGKEEEKNVLALAVLRHYITEDVLNVITVGEGGARRQ